MNFTPVTSSFINSVGYDAATQTMVVKFANGSMQTHTGTTPDKHRELIKAGSVGSHYNKNFRTTKAAAAVTKNPIK